MEKAYYIIFVVTIALLTISFNSYQICLLFLAISFLTVLLWGITRVMRKKLALSFLDENHIVQKGVPFVQKVLIKNSFFLPVSRVSVMLSVSHHFGEESSEKILSTTVQARGERMIALQMCCEYSGLVWIRMEKAVVYDYFGIFKFQISPLYNTSFMVLPNHYPMPEFVLESYGRLMGARTETNRIGDDLSELLGYRAYGSGDKLNRIDWKLSAKCGELMVKEYCAVNDEQILLLFDLFSIQAGMRLCEMDAIIDLLFNLSYELLYQQKKFVIAWYDSSKNKCAMEEVTSGDALNEVLSKLYNISIFLEEEHVFEQLCLEASSLWFSNIFYLGYRKEEYVVDCLRKIQHDALLHIILLMQEVQGREKSASYKEMGLFLHRVAMADLKNELLSLKEE